MISGESGDTDSPEAFSAFGQESNFRESILFCLPASPGRQKKSFLCDLSVSAVKPECSIIRKSG
jgi:hypothetical protein